MAIGLDISLSSVMVVGVNTRPIVKSAKNLGLGTVAVDCFDDVDLVANADILISMRSSGRGSSLLELSLKALETYDVDAVLLASGTEHYPQLLKKLARVIDIIGNRPAHLELCRKKEKLFRIAEKLGIPYPRTRKVQKLIDALKTAEDIGYPVVLKPAFGGGGVQIRLVMSSRELERSFGWVLRAGDGRSLYVQQYIPGINASTSVLSNGDKARCLTVNEQVIGDKRLGVPRPFGYCGNIVPLNAKREAMARISEYSQALCSEIGLLGSNGVDFVLSGDKPYLMEINPRFQNTIDCVEGLLGINLVEAHIRSYQGELGKYGKPRGYSTKLIIYAKGDVKIPNLTGLSNIVDVPKEASIIRRGKPICSVLKFGDLRWKVIADDFAAAEKVYRLC